MTPLPPELAKRLRHLVTVSSVELDLARRFERAGHRLYLVGGSVRDALLARDVPADLDFATDATPEQVIEIVRGWHEGQWLTGVEFGTVSVNKRGRRLEITTFRGERYAEGSRHPEVHRVPSIEADLARRDFTINAMALRLPEREFVDPFGGAAHLAQKVLDTPLSPEESFSDDPLRMLRAARFVSQLGVKPAPRVVVAMRAQRERLRIVSAERIRDELVKIMDSDRPADGLDLATETGLCELFLPELPALALEQDREHRHKDVYRHTLAVVQNAVQLDPGPEPDTELRLAALLHDIGKPATRRFGPEGVSFHHHEVVGARMAEERLRALHFPSDLIADVSKLVFMHLRFHTFSLGWSDSAVRRYVRDAGPLLDKLNRLVRADCTTQNRFRARQISAAVDRLEERIARLAVEEDLKRIRPPLDGHEVMSFLGIPPGPIVGGALDYLLELRLDRGEIPKEDAYRHLSDWVALMKAWSAERGIPWPSADRRARGGA